MITNKNYERYDRIREVIEKFKLFEVEETKDKTIYTSHKSNIQIIFFEGRIEIVLDDLVAVEISYGISSAAFLTVLFDVFEVEELK